MSALPLVALFAGWRCCWPGAGVIAYMALRGSGVALLATWLPARRATRVDLLVAMRSE